MLPDVNNSKELIKNRMLKHALTYWGIKNTDDLDPVVKLILEALSSELYNLGNEIKDTQVRILEKIANLLAPDFLTSPNPAHGILQAVPVEPVEWLTPATSFYLQKKISTRQNEVLDGTLDIVFTPVDNLQVFDAQVGYLLMGGNLFTYDASFNKLLVAKSKAKTVETNSIWLGIKLNPKIQDIQNLSFCFDWKNVESRLAHRIYQLLPLTKWSINDREVKKKDGLSYAPSENKNDNYDDIFLEYDILHLMEKDITRYYDQKFVSIDDTFSNRLEELKLLYPDVFKNLFPENELVKLNEKLLWIKISFPPAMQQEYLDEVYIYLNAFPVVNRQINEVRYRLKGGSNIIPLKTEPLHQFLSVKSLSDEKHQYKAVPYRKMEEEELGSFTLRNGGVERFDGRNAREMISYLLELLRSESAAFAAYGYDFIATTLKEMNQKISLMEQKTRGNMNQTAEIPNYIIVKPMEGQDMMYAAYWTTLAEGANNLRAGTRLQLAKGVKIKQDSMTLLTTTTGGKNRLKPEERLNAFRYGMMTRNRVITKEDIRNFCAYELGERIEKVEVEKGFEMSVHTKEGFRRTIDVILTAQDTDNLEQPAWQVLCEQLKTKLESRSGHSNYYRVMMKD